jgi:hypothetical protein
LAALALLTLSFPAAAQTVLIRVMDGDASRPMFGALAYLVGSDGQTAKNALTDERGRALFIGIAPGAYRVRAEMIGMATAETALFDVAVGTTISQELRLESSAIQLEGLAVELEAGRCRVRPGGEGLVVSEVWEEARKALSAASFTDQRGSYRYETIRYDRQIDRNSGVILSEEQRRREGYMRTPFESLPAEELVTEGFVRPDGRDFLYYAPDATVLLSDEFLDTHCFKMADSNDESGLIGLGFEPTGENRRVPDIQGTMWLDPVTAELRFLEYRYTYLTPDMTAPEVGGRVDFQRMPDGTWIVPEWWIRMPILTTQTGFDGRPRAYIARFHQTGGLVVAAREAGGRSLGQRVETGGFEGLVMDSLGVPLRGVRVGVVGSNQEVFSNAEGKFSITGLPEGRYQIRFVDGGLEQMGYVPDPVARDVVRGELAYMEYQTPSIGDVLFEACRGVEREEGSVTFAGTVIDPRGLPAEGATVRVVWRNYSSADAGAMGVSGGLRERTDGFEATTSPTGFFRFCGVPANQDLTVTAARDEMTSEEYTVQILDFETGALRVLELQRR